MYIYILTHKIDNLHSFSPFPRSCSGTFCKTRTRAQVVVGPKAVVEKAVELAPGATGITGRSGGAMNFMGI